MKKLNEKKWLKILEQKIIKEKKNYLGICLGMQILTNEGEEFNNTKGLGYIGGKVEDLKNLTCKLPLPHTGWNNLNIKKENLIFKSIKNLSNFYFNHSFVTNSINEQYIISDTNYGVNFISSINKDNIYEIEGVVGY